MSALPKAVRDQIAAADVVAKEFRDSLAPAPADPATPPAAPAAPAAAAPVAPAPAPAPAPPSDEEGWEKRYRVLQGKYNAEVPRLQGQVRDQATQMSSMQNQLNLLMVQSTRTPAEPASAAAPASKKLVTPEEEKAFGADLIDVIRRVSREELAPVEQRTAASVDTRVKKVEQTAEQAAEAARTASFDKMMTLLTQRVPNWEALNTDENFVTWLDQTDPFSGAKRQAMLNHAFNNNDGPRVVAFFTSYQNEHAALNPAPAIAPAPAPAAPAAPAAPQQLEKLIAPGTPKAGAGSAPNEAQKRIWTSAEIHEFNQKRNQLVVARKPIPPSMEVTEREILAAAREGRVR